MCLETRDVIQWWTADPLALGTVVGSSALYGRGVSRLWKRVGVGHGVRRWELSSFALGQLTLLTALVSPIDRLSDIFFSARIFDAADALRMGFVTRVESRETFDKVVDDWCAATAENAPLTLRALKRTVNELLRDPDERAMQAAEAAIDACFASDDYREGARAFMEKRRPVFRGA